MEAERHEGRWQTRPRGRPRLILRPLSRTGENPPYGILGEAMETSASFEARSAPLPYPTANERTYGSVRGVLGNQHPYRDPFSFPGPEKGYLTVLRIFDPEPPAK